MVTRSETRPKDVKLRAERNELQRLEGRDILRQAVPHHERLSVRRLSGAGQEPDQRRLPRAVLAEEDAKLTRLDGERNLLQRGNSPRIALAHHVRDQGGVDPAPLPRCADRVARGDDPHRGWVTPPRSLLCGAAYSGAPEGGVEYEPDRSRCAAQIVTGHLVAFPTLA